MTAGLPLPPGSPTEDGAMHLGSKTFGAADQEAFARISSDTNPIHMDAAVARRLLSGRQVVHGINVVLHAIEFWLGQYDLTPAYVGCSFNNPISIGDHVTFEEVRNASGRHTIAATVNGLLCAAIVLDVRVAVGAKGSGLTGVPLGSCDAVQAARTDVPLQLPPGEHVGRAYSIPVEQCLHAEQFTLIRKRMPAGYVSALAGLSYFVGMVCPGLHSIFSSFSVALSDEVRTASSLVFGVENYDDRFRLFNVSVGGYFTGELRAFRRPPPCEQQRIREIRSYVHPGEFRGTTSLIIGGSRGLGELTAKILASGGGKTVVTYAQSIEQAVRVREEIEESCLAQCRIVKYDVLADDFTSLDIDLDSVGMVYFFATPRIFRKKPVLFDGSVYAEFTNVYVREFYRVCASLESRLNHHATIYFPSSVAVEKRGNDLMEYAMAKAAAELLIENINASFKKLRAYSTRLPRLNTDQTATVFKVKAESNIEVMLPIVRSMAGADRAADE